MIKRLAFVAAIALSATFATSDLKAKPAALPQSSISGATSDANQSIIPVHVRRSCRWRNVRVCRSWRASGTCRSWRVTRKRVCRRIPHSHSAPRGSYSY